MFEKTIKIEAGSFNMGCSIDDNGCDPDEGEKGGTAEWVYNWFSEMAISQLYGKGLLNKLDTGRWRVIRGGAWVDLKKRKLTVLPIIFFSFFSIYPGLMISNSI